MFERISIEQPDPEGQLYDPEGYKRVMQWYYVYVLVILGAFAVAVVGTALLAEFGSGGPPVEFIPVLVICGIIVFVALLAYSGELREHQTNVAALKHSQLLRTNKAAQSTDRRTRKMGKQMDEIRSSAKIAGDVIVHGDNASIVIGSGAINITNKYSQTDPALAEALKIVLGHIEQTKNESAARFLEEFSNELGSKSPSKTRLESFWNSVVSAAPTIKLMTDVVSTVSKLFA